MSVRNEGDVAHAFVSLAGLLAGGADAVDLLGELTEHCTHLLDVAAAGLMLADRRGALHVLAASSEKARLLETYQIQREEGPCRECYLAGTPVHVVDLRSAAARWPHFAPTALAAGFASVHALPLRLQSQILGALGLFRTTATPLDADDLTLAQAFADVASVALVQDRIASDANALSRQLQTALSSRVVLEQAKGVLAQIGGLDMDQAFVALRGYARDHNERLTDIAHRVVARTLAGEAVLEHARHAAPRQRPPSSS